MLDWNKIKDKTSQFISDAGQKIRQYTPESFSKEKKFVNSLVISMALMTMADKKASTEEVVAAIDLIKDIDEIKDLNMTTDAIELYELHVEELSNVVGNPTKWILTEAKLLSELSKMQAYPEYPPMIEALVNHIANVDGHLDETEVQMQKKILVAISK